MTTNQEGRQAAIRDSTSTAYGVAADWHALFDDAGISAGTFNERLLAWINAELSASYNNLVSAMQAYAEDAGYDGWEDMATLVLLAMNGAETLLDGETQGLAFDFTDQSALIIDTGTPANNYESTGIVSSGALVGPSGKLTYTSPSNKLTLQSDGYYKYQAHNLLTYSESLANWTNFNSTDAANVCTISAGQTQGGMVLAVSGVVASASYRYAVRVTPTTHNYIVLRYQGDGSEDHVAAVFDLGSANTTATQTDVGTTSGTIVSTSQTAVGDGSYDLEIIFSVVSTSSPFACIEFAEAATGNTFSVSGVAVWSGTAAGTEKYTLHRAHLHRTPANTDYIKTTSAAKYALPLEYDTSGNCLGLLVEEARTNSHVYSNTFSNAAWSKVGSYEQNATGLDGLTSAWTLTDGVTGSPLAFRFSQAPTLTANVYSHSIYAKAGTNSWLRILVDATASGSVNAFYNLSTGELGTVSGSGITASITSVGNGWYRCTAIATMTAAACRVYFQMCTADNQAGYIGDGTGTMLFQHAQTEQGAFPTSPIITYGATATRSADNISIATSAFPYSATEGSVYVQYGQLSDTSSVDYPWIIYDGTIVNYIGLRHDNTSAVKFKVTASSVAQADIGILVTTTYKASSAWAANDFAATADGAAVSTDAAGSIPTVTTLVVGSAPGISSSGQSTAHIKAISYVPRRKTDAELVTETA